MRWLRVRQEAPQDALDVGRNARAGCLCPCRRVGNLATGSERSGGRRHLAGRLPTRNAGWPTASAARHGHPASRPCCALYRCSSIGAGNCAEAGHCGRPDCNSRNTAQRIPPTATERSACTHHGSSSRAGPDRLREPVAATGVSQGAHADHLSRRGTTQHCRRNPAWTWPHPPCKGRASAAPHQPAAFSRSARPRCTRRGGSCRRHPLNRGAGRASVRSRPGSRVAPLRWLAACRARSRSWRCPAEGAPHPAAAQRLTRIASASPRD